MWDEKSTNHVFSRITHEWMNRPMFANRNLAKFNQRSKLIWNTFSCPNAMMFSKTINTPTHIFISDKSCTALSQNMIRFSHSEKNSKFFSLLQEFHQLLKPEDPFDDPPTRLISKTTMLDAWENYQWICFCPKNVN